MAEDDKDRDEPERARLLRVYRGWKRAMLTRTLAWWVGASSLRTILAGLVTILTGILLPLDGSLWGTQPFLEDLLPRSGRPIAMALVAIWLATTLLVARWLWQATERPDRDSLGWRASLALLGGVPVLGLLVVPGWRSLQDRLPSWELHRGPRVPALDLAGPGTPAACPGSPTGAGRIP